MDRAIPEKYLPLPSPEEAQAKRAERRAHRKATAAARAFKRPFLKRVTLIRRLNDSLRGRGYETLRPEWRLEARAIYEVPYALTTTTIVHIALLHYITGEHYIAVGHAICCPGDVFDTPKGICLAETRAIRELAVKAISMYLVQKDPKHEFCCGYSK